MGTPDAAWFDRCWVCVRDIHAPPISAGVMQETHHALLVLLAIAVAGAVGVTAAIAIPMIRQRRVKSGE